MEGIHLIDYSEEIEIQNLGLAKDLNPTKRTIESELKSFLQIFNSSEEQMIEIIKIPVAVILNNHKCNQINTMSEVYNTGLVYYVLQRTGNKMFSITEEFMSNNNFVNITSIFEDKNKSLFFLKNKTVEDILDKISPSVIHGGYTEIKRKEKK